MQNFSSIRFALGCTLALGMTACASRQTATQMPAARYDVNQPTSSAYYLPMTPPAQQAQPVQVNQNVYQGVPTPEQSIAQANAGAPQLSAQEQSYETVVIDQQIPEADPYVDGSLGYEQLSTGQRIEVVTYVHTYPQPIEQYSRVQWAGRWYYNVQGNFVFWDPYWSSWCYYWGPPAPLILAWNAYYPWMGFSWGMGYYGAGWYWGGVAANGYHVWGRPPTWYSPQRYRRGDYGRARGTRVANGRPTVRNPGNRPTSRAGGRPNSGAGRPNGATRPSATVRGQGRPNATTGRPNSGGRPNATTRPTTVPNPRATGRSATPRAQPRPTRGQTRVPQPTRSGPKAVPRTRTPNRPTATPRTRSGGSTYRISPGSSSPRPTARGRSSGGSSSSPRASGRSWGGGGGRSSGGGGGRSSGGGGGGRPRPR